MIRFSVKEREQMEQLMERIIKFYKRRFFGGTENHIFDNHLWQFTFRRLLQTSLVLYKKSPEAREFFEYAYELWTCRAPATGFNRDGIWMNGTCYFQCQCSELILYSEPFFLSGRHRFSATSLVSGGGEGNGL